MFQARKIKRGLSFVFVWFLVAIAIVMMVFSTISVAVCNGSSPGGSSTGPGGSGGSSGGSSGSGGTLQSAGPYSVRQNGDSCEASGYLSIMDEDECKRALQALNFDTSGFTFISSNESPPYCYGDTNFQTARSSGSEGSSGSTRVSGGSSSSGAYNRLPPDFTERCSADSTTVCICRSTPASQSGSGGSSQSDTTTKTCANGGPNGRAVSCAKSVSAKSGDTFCGTACSDDSEKCCTGLTKDSDMCEESRCNDGGGGDMCICGDPSDQDSPENCCNSKKGLCPACPLAFAGEYLQEASTNCGSVKSEFSIQLKKYVQFSTDITTTADCKAAATALGFTVQNVISQSISGRPSGCLITKTSAGTSTVTFNKQKQSTVVQCDSEF